MTSPSMVLGAEKFFGRLCDLSLGQYARVATVVTHAGCDRQAAERFFLSEPRMDAAQTMVDAFTRVGGGKASRLFHYASSTGRRNLSAQKIELPYRILKEEADYFRGIVGVDVIDAALKAHKLVAKTIPEQVIRTSAEFEVKTPRTRILSFHEAALAHRGQRVVGAEPDVRRQSFDLEVSPGLVSRSQYTALAELAGLPSLKRKSPEGPALGITPGLATMWIEWLSDLTGESYTLVAGHVSGLAVYSEGPYVLIQEPLSGAFLLIPPGKGKSPMPYDNALAAKTGMQVMRVTEYAPIKSIRGMGL